MSIQTVGIIGAGRMGMPIIGHLKRAGFEVLVSERDAGRRADIEARGGQWSELAALAARSQAILICVGYDSEVRELLGGAGGLFETALAGAIIAVLSTIQPKTMEEFAAQGEPRGIHVIDSTICRGGRAADDGTLLSFVAGDAAVVERITPVLKAYSSDVVHSGKVGTAQVSKAANNLILWACVVADHEALALADRYGLDVNMLREALMKSSANNDVLKHWGTNEMEWAQDDLAIIAAMAQERGISLPQTGLTREICRSLKPRRYKLDEYGC